ncbi:hypothetical protein HYQ46_000957 [Verticillium longisporum]|nr:hypothetical protein HYQ46_000957 [Verticillium longisporum]
MGSVVRTRCVFWVARFQSDREQAVMYLRLEQPICIDNSQGSELISTHDTFHPFPRFPLEIRRLIWEQARSESYMFCAFDTAASSNHNMQQQAGKIFVRHVFNHHNHPRAQYSSEGHLFVTLDSAMIHSRSASEIYDDVLQQHPECPGGRDDEFGSPQG